MKALCENILVAGASSGIGLACAAMLHEAGYRVWGTFRRTEINEVKFAVRRMDVDDDASVNACVADILNEAGRIDAAINCAGWGLSGAVEDTTPEQARAQFETNVCGTLRVCRAVLPGMRERRSGLIVNISSLGGRITVPFHGMYCASKFAVEAITQSLRMESAPFGVRVVRVLPGDIATRFTDNRAMTAIAPHYKEACGRSLAAMAANERGGPGPEYVARVVKKVVETRNPKPSYIAAPLSQRLAPAVQKIIPESMFEKIIMKHFGA